MFKIICNQLKFFIGFKFDLGPCFSLEVRRISADHLSLFTGKQSAIVFFFFSFLLGSHIVKKQ